MEHAAADTYDVVVFSPRPTGTTIDPTLAFQHAGRIVTAAHV
jgi:hypothetical protein